MTTLQTGVKNDTQDQAAKFDSVVRRTNPIDVTTVGAATYTAAQILGGIIFRDPNGGARTDTFPTAALLVKAMPSPSIGDTVDVMIINGADAAETITLAAGTGGSFNALQSTASKDIAQNAKKLVNIRITGVAAGSEAYVMYA